MNPGHWQVSVEANAPFQNAHFEIKDVKPGMDVDLGDVRLRK